MVGVGRNGRGGVGLRRAVGAAQRLRLSWVERGGPRVTPPTRKGFGHVVIESMVAQMVTGEVSTDFGATA